MGCVDLLGQTIPNRIVGVSKGGRWRASVGDGGRKQLIDVVIAIRVNEWDLAARLL